MILSFSRDTAAEDDHKNASIMTFGGASSDYAVIHWLYYEKNGIVQVQRIFAVAPSLQSSFVDDELKVIRV
jgi:hypothetical protein